MEGATRPWNCLVVLWLQGSSSPHWSTGTHSGSLPAWLWCRKTSPTSLQDKLYISHCFSITTSNLSCSLLSTPSASGAALPTITPNHRPPVESTHRNHPNQRPPVRVRCSETAFRASRFVLPIVYSSSSSQYRVPVSADPPLRQDI